MISLRSPLILASKSSARITMLENVGLEFTSIPADIDEDAIIKDMTAQHMPDEIAAALATQKAQHISKDHPDAYVIGSDQILVFEDTLMQKSPTLDDAREKLSLLRGKTHHLISAVSVIKNGAVCFTHTKTAPMKMRDFDDAFLENYLILARDEILACVGGYAFESYGAWLFEDTDANLFTIMGMPLLPLLGFLYQETQ